MDIYSDRVPIGKVKDVVWFKRGRFCSRLVGVNISQKESQVNVEPIWVPLVAVDRDGPNTFITFATSKPKLLIVLYQYWPFFHIERTDVIRLEDE